MEINNNLISHIITSDKLSVALSLFVFHTKKPLIKSEDSCFHDINRLVNEPSFEFELKIIV